MKLSRLVYLCVKNVNYLDDISFSYDAFKEGRFDEDPNYGLYIQNCYSPLNEAIARLNDLERIPYEIQEITVSNNICDIKTLTKDVKEVIGIGQTTSNGIRKLEHRPFGLDKVYVNGYIDKTQPVIIEFKEDIEHFDSSSFHYEYTKDSNDVYHLVESLSYDYELTEHGINNSICNYLIEYVVGKLYEGISADLANLHISRAEAYFANINQVKSLFNQAKISNVYKIGE